MKVGVIGLGDIAQKAYLPVLTAGPGLELHLQTRTPATLARVAATYRIPDAQCHSASTRSSARAWTPPSCTRPPPCIPRS